MKKLGIIIIIAVVILLGCEQKKAVEDNVIFCGKIQKNTLSVIPTYVEGHILELYVKNGQHIKVDQPLAKMEAITTQALYVDQLLKFMADKKRWQTQNKRAIDNALEVKIGTVSPRLHEYAMDDLMVKKIELMQSKYNYDLLESMLVPNMEASIKSKLSDLSDNNSEDILKTIMQKNDSTSYKIFAKSEGIVVFESKLSIGQYFDKNKVMFEIVDPKEFYISAFIKKSVAQHLYPTQPVTIKLPNIDYTLIGMVRNINPYQETTYLFSQEHQYVEVIVDIDPTFFQNGVGFFQGQIATIYTSPYESINYCQ